MKLKLNTAIAAIIFIASGSIIAGCSKQEAPPPPAANTQNATRNLSPDDTVKAHMNQMQQGGAGGQQAGGASGH